MTIDEAIKVLTAYSENMETDLIDREYFAIKLGIEALKWVKQWRKDFAPGMIYRLPGETRKDFRLQGVR